MRALATGPLLLCALASLLAAGCGADPEAPETPETPALEPDVWNMIELPGTVCGNGSQYRFFVNPSPTASRDLLFVFEGGGACWDFASCSGETPLGASNTDGITEGHMAIYQAVFPVFFRNDETNEFRDFNYIYMPYCTGDVHTGDVVKTYADPDGARPDLVFHHRGHENTRLAAAWAKDTFRSVSRLVTHGCSAGGVGSISNHWFVRNIIAPERAYLFDDSGPVFPGSVHSQPLYETIQRAWGLDEVFGSLPFPYDAADMGGLALTLADALPDDRLAVTFFQRDHVLPDYSYRAFFPGIDEEARLGLFRDDTDLFVQAADAKENLTYFLPYWRARLDSHCTTVIDYKGTEIQEANVDLHDLIQNLLDDDAPLEGYRESPQPGEDGTPP